MRLIAYAKIIEAATYIILKFEVLTQERVSTKLAKSISFNKKIINKINASVVFIK